jgi:hypothetical protein
MLVKTITFRDLDGNELTSDFYFNISLEELTGMELDVEGGLGEHFKKIVAEGDGKELFAAFRKLIAKSYGIKSEDGLRFIKSEQISQEFMQTDAYSELFLELATDAEAAAKFFNAVIPAKDLERFQKAKAANPISQEETATAAWLREKRQPTQQELMNMPREELLLAMQHKINPELQ